MISLHDISYLNFGDCELFQFVFAPSRGARSCSRVGAGVLTIRAHDTLKRRDRALRAPDRAAWAWRPRPEQAQGRACARCRRGRLRLARAAISGWGWSRTLGIVDDDVVALSNLHRQVIHATDDVGRPKTESAQAAIARINPHVAVEPIAVRLDENNARAIVRRFDVVLDGSDNFATRYALSDTCFHERRPLVSAALGEFDGTLTTLKPYENGPDGKPNPTYRCLFPEAPPPGTIPTCAEAGVLGALAAFSAR